MPNLMMIWMSISLNLFLMGCHISEHLNLEDGASESKVTSLEDDYDSSKIFQSNLSLNSCAGGITSIYSCASTTSLKYEWYPDPVKCVKNTTYVKCPYGCSNNKCNNPDDPYRETGIKLKALRQLWSASNTDHLPINNHSVPSGYNTAENEGLLFYLYNDSLNNIPLYRLFSRGDHMISRSSNEGGYINEGILGYMSGRQLIGMKAIKRWYKGSIHDHRIGGADKNYSAQGYALDGTLGFGYEGQANNFTNNMIQIGNSKVVVGMSRGAGGSIWELRHNASGIWQNYVNTPDTGRQANIALFLQQNESPGSSYGSGCNLGDWKAPTESGDHYCGFVSGHANNKEDAAQCHGSPMIYFSSNNTEAYTASRPLIFRPHCAHGGGDTTPIMWNGFFSKRVEVGFGGRLGIIRVSTHSHFREATKGMANELSTPIFLDASFDRARVAEKDSNNNVRFTPIAEGIWHGPRDGHIVGALWCKSSNFKRCVGLYKRLDGTTSDLRADRNINRGVGEYGNYGYNYAHLASWVPVNNVPAGSDRVDVIYYVVGSEAEVHADMTWLARNYY